MLNRTNGEKVGNNYFVDKAWFSMNSMVNRNLQFYFVNMTADDGTRYDTLLQSSPFSTIEATIVSIKDGWDNPPERYPRK